MRSLHLARMGNELADEIRRAQPMGSPTPARPAIGTACRVARIAAGKGAYFEAGGTLEKAQATAAHESPRMTKLCSRTSDPITLDKVERTTI